MRLAAPIRPGKVLCSGINYRATPRRIPNAKMPTEPFFFAKMPTPVAGPDDAVAAPAADQADGLRGRVRVVIGKRLSHAAEER